MKELRKWLIEFWARNGDSNNSEFSLQRVGEAIWENSTINSTENTGWNGDYAEMCIAENPFSVRGGRWGNTTRAGIFAFNDNHGYCHCHIGFRTILICE